MNFTQEDFQRALRISEAIQQYLSQTGMVNARSTDLYDMLARNDLVEKDRHNGIHFRKFLRKLKEANLLHLIAGCTYVENSRGVEWYFNLSARKLNNTSTTSQKATIVHKPAMGKEEIEALILKEMPHVAALPVRSNPDYTNQQLDIKKNYPRAYEIWTNEEYEILKRVYQQCKNIDAVAKLLQRQPHIVSEKLKLLLK
jgi:hypothetical protein